jgi:hypothetical protein
MTDAVTTVNNSFVALQTPIASSSRQVGRTRTLPGVQGLDQSQTSGWQYDEIPDLYGSLYGLELCYSMVQRLVAHLPRHK